MVGEIQQIIIFESALDDDDRGLIEAYLGSPGELPPQPDPTTLSPLELTIHDGIGELKWNADAHLLFSSDLDEWFIEPEAISPMSWEIDKEKEFFALRPSSLRFREEWCCARALHPTRTARLNTTSIPASCFSAGSNTTASIIMAVLMISGGVPSIPQAVGPGYSIS